MPKQKGLMAPLGHWQRKCGRPATNVMMAVNHKNAARVVLPMAFIVVPRRVNTA